MRSTVGPLPSAVYWRRRAVVLGAVLLGVIILFVSCSGGDDKKNGQGTSASQYPTPAPAKSTPEDEPSFVDGQPGGGPSLPGPGDLTGAPATGVPATGTSLDPGATGGTGTGTGTGTGANTNVTAPAGTTCADTEIALTPIPAATSVKRGVPLELRLKIKNVGTRTCNRDVGAGAQELYIDLGANKIWSSDTCSPANGSEIVAIPPNVEREYRITWNGRMTTKCTANQPDGPAPAAGAYELRARLSTEISAPVALAILD